ILGVIDMQADMPGVFNEENLPVFEAMANQLAATLRGVQAFAEAQQAATRAAFINRRLTRASWENFLGRLSQGEHLGYHYDLQNVAPVDEPLTIASDAVDGRTIARPIELRGEPIGTILLNEDNPRAWAPEDLALIDDVAERVAQVVEQFRAFDETQAALAETAALYDASRRISTAEGLQAVVAAGVEALNVPAINRAVLMAFDYDESGRLDVARVIGNWHSGRGTSPSPVGTAYSVQDYPAFLTGVTPDPVFADDTLTDERADPALCEMLRAINVRAFAMLPLWVSGRQIGALFLESDEPYHFTEQQIRPSAALARQIAFTVQNQLLFDQVQTRATELQTVAEVGAQASTILDVSELLWTVSGLTKERFGLYHAHVYLINEAGDRLVLAAGAGEVGRQMVAAGHGIPLSHPRSLVARAARERQGVIVNDVRQALDFLPNPMLPNTRSEMAIPMIVGDRLLGVLDVQSSVANRFSEEDTRVQGTLAAQIAAAVQNAGLFTEVQIEADRRARLYELGQHLAESLDPAAIARSAVDDLAALMDVPEANLFRYVESDDALELLAAAGPAGQKMAEWMIPLADCSSAARVIRQREVVIEEDTTDPAYKFARQMGLTAFMLVPVTVADQVIGMLVLGDTRGPRRFHQDDLLLVQNVALQVGISLQNAYLYIEQVRATEQLREVDRLKSEFLASMSHELRTPLNSIIGYAEVLLDGIDGDLTDDMEEDVEAIHGSGKHLLNLINDILDLAKIEAGQMDLIVEHIELGPFVRDVMNTSRVLLGSKPVELLVDIPNDLPVVEADSLRLRQIVSNLVGNAIKFTEQGSITVHAEVYASDPSMLAVSVIDTGVGISAENLPLIFERFRQLDQSATRRVGGTGLGLSITRQLVQMLGGDLWVESQPGSGSVFTFTLPIVPVAEPGD
ncbi:MAG: GAF domain-containing protein, partial [Anaerolineae bacterium]|nr:GAF domain-containing protein [Anaerolineae bacterium]